MLSCNYFKVLPFHTGDRESVIKYSRNLSEYSTHYFNDMTDWHEDRKWGDYWLWNKWYEYMTIVEIKKLNIYLYWNDTQD
jgi:hypothetical protein